jgi:TolC family type I secretion outer membrane protein
VFDNKLNSKYLNTEYLKQKYFNQSNQLNINQFNINKFIGRFSISLLNSFLFLLILFCFFFLLALNFNSAVYAINTSAKINSDINSSINANLYADSNTNNNSSSNVNYSSNHSNSNNSINSNNISSSSNNNNNGGNSNGSNINNSNSNSGNITKNTANVIPAKAGIQPSSNITKARKNKKNTSNLAPYPLNLIQAYKLAVKHDHAFKADIYGKRASDALGWEGLSVLLPHLNASGNVSRYDFIKPPPYYFSYTSRTEGVSLSQPIFSMKRFFEYSQYKTRASIGNAKFESQKQNLILTVAEVYLDVLAAQDYIKDLNSQKNAVHQELEQAKKLLSAGAGTKTDVYDARAKYYSVLSQIVGAKNGLENNYMKFKNVVGVSGKNLEPLKHNIPLSTPYPSNIKYWINIAKKHNPMLKYYKDNEGYYEDGVKKAISLHLPSVDFVAGYSATNTQEYIQTPPIKYYNVGFQINIPIFNGGYAFAKTAESENLVQRANQEYEKELHKNNRKVSQSFLGIKGDIVKIKMLKLAVKSARISLKGNKMGLTAGVKTMTDVLNAVQRLYDVRVKLLKAKYEYMISLLNLDFNAGVLSEYDLHKINKWLKNS